MNQLATCIVTRLNFKAVLLILKVTDVPEEIAARQPAPRFACFPNGEEQEYFLFVERKIICTVKSFTKCLMMWFIMHYVFNLQYAKPVKEVGLFLQEFVFTLPESGSKNKTSRYLTVRSDISKYT